MLGEPFVNININFFFFFEKKGSVLWAGEEGK